MEHWRTQLQHLQPQALCGPASSRYELPQWATDLLSWPQQGYSTFSWELPCFPQLSRQIWSRTSNGKIKGYWWYACSLENKTQCLCFSLDCLFLCFSSNCLPTSWFLTQSPHRCVPPNIRARKPVYWRALKTLRGDFNVRCSHTKRTYLLDHFPAQFDLLEVSLSHPTYHHFVGNGQWLLLGQTVLLENPA